MNKLHERFNIYSERGFYLFPINPKTKRPSIKGWQEKSTLDVSQLIAWSVQFPDCNWGVFLTKSGLVAVDVDHKHGGMEKWAKLIEEHKEPTTLKQFTSTKGLHYVFKAEKGIKYRGQICPGLDVKHNGFIVISPSIGVNGKSYIWDRWGESISGLPDWLGSLVLKEDRKLGRGSAQYKFGSEYLRKLVATLREYELSYEEWIGAGMALYSATGGAYEGLELYLELTSGVSYTAGDEDLARDKWESFTGYEGNGITVKTLGYYIREKGGTVPTPYFQDDIEVEKTLKKEKINEKYKEDDSGWTDDSGRFVSISRGFIVDWFNGRGFSIVESEVEKPIFRIGDDGTLYSMSERGLRHITEDRFYSYPKETKTEVKEVQVPAYREWLESNRRRTYSRICFKPKADERELNLWKPLNLDRAIMGEEPTLLLAMIRDSLCGGHEDSYEYLIDWLAHIIQSPEERSSTVPVLISMQGAGKGILMDHVMSKILGGFYTAVATGAQLTAKFNADLSRKFLTFIDEATWRGNKQEDGILKRFIGSPTMSVEQKFGARYSIENYSRYLVGSNNKEAVALERGNRRYNIIEADDSYANNLPYFQKVMRAIESGKEVEKFLGFLLERDLIGHNPHMIIEGNTAGGRSKLATEGPVARFWGDLFFEEPIQVFDKERGLDCNLAFEYFSDYCGKIKTYEKSISRFDFWAKTTELVPTLPKKTRVQKDGVRKMYRSILPSEMCKRFCTALVLEPPEILVESDFFLTERF